MLPISTPAVKAATAHDRLPQKQIQASGRSEGRSTRNRFMAAINNVSAVAQSDHSNVMCAFLYITNDPIPCSNPPRMRITEKIRSTIFMQQPPMKSSRVCRGCPILSPLFGEWVGVENLQMRKPQQHSSQRAAQQRTENGNRRIAPVRSAFA